MNLKKYFREFDEAYDNEYNGKVSFKSEIECFEFEKDVIEIKKFIKGNDGRVTRFELTFGMRHKYNQNQLYKRPDGIIPKMLDASIVKRTKEKGITNRPVTVYKLIDK